VVKARVTSHQRLRVQIPPAAQAAVAQLAEQWQNTWAADSRRKKVRCGEGALYLPGWRGEELLRSTMMWGSCPATLLDYSSRFAFGRRESRTSRRFAPGDGKLPGMAAPKTISCRQSPRANDEIGRGERQGYFASGAGDVGSIPTWVERSSSSWIERLMSLAGSSRPAV
jgi:hypothetical protein